MTLMSRFFSCAVFLVAVLATTGAVAQSEKASAESIEWISFEEAVERSKTDKRKILIDVYTDWCGWCKVMDKNTFTDKHIASLISGEFYAVKLNAEQREPITFRGTTFKHVQSGRNGYHELAASLLQNELSYPNFVFLSEDFKIIPLIPGKPSLPGYRKPEDFHFFLQYVAEERFMEMPVADFQKIYKSPYRLKQPVN